MAKAIIVENLSKAYQLGQIGTGTISRDIERWWAKRRGKEDPFLKIGEINDHSVRGASDVTWSLKDINFEIERGDAVGIIGRNGAGKSTLLKILSRITSPTTGSVKVKGRIASLLEVGTGFHPELTGKENIFLNGAILGMRKKEIARKFDEIVDFAGVQRYIDTPVKRYSSGMYVRLAFAVAAYLESETLIVDEVLAVGDAEFQKKCLGKMKDVSMGEGRTVLFVSHNMNAVKHLCTKGILLTNGSLKLKGTSEEVVEYYLNNNQNNSGIASTITVEEDSEKEAQILSVNVMNADGDLNATFDIQQDIYIEINYVIKKERGGLALVIDVFKNDDLIFRSFDTDTQPVLLNSRKPGYYNTLIKLPSYLKAGIYGVNLQVGLLKINPLDTVNGQIGFEIIESSVDTTYKSYSEKRPGIVKAELEWTINSIP